MSIDGLAAGGDSGIADATIFLERTFRLRRLSLGSDARFFLQRALDHSLLWHGSCPFEGLSKRGDARSASCGSRGKREPRLVWGYRPGSSSRARVGRLARLPRRGEGGLRAQCNEGRVRAQYCKSTRGNLWLVPSRAGKSKSTSRDSTQRTLQSKSGEHGEWPPFVPGLWVGMIMRQLRRRTEVRRYQCAGNCRRDAVLQRQPLRLRCDAFGFCAFVGLAGFQVLEFLCAAAGPVDYGAVYFFVVGYAESNR